jgi:hypothetical protein
VPPTLRPFGRSFELPETCRSFIYQVGGMSDLLWDIPVLPASHRERRLRLTAVVRDRCQARLTCAGLGGSTARPIRLFPCEFKADGPTKFSYSAEIASTIACSTGE